jgi:hypothetical protein
VHASHSVRPVTVLCVPAAHRSQLAKPGLLVNVPRAQSAQDDWLNSDCAVPLPHG